MNTITIYSDYVCPFCLLAEKRVTEAIGNRDIQIHWQPFELRPDPTPTLRPEDEYLPRIWNQSVYPLAKILDVDIKLPSISPQPRTYKAFKLLFLAQERGVDHDYSMKVFHAFFKANQDIGDTNLLIRIASEVGISEEAAMEAIESDLYDDHYKESQRYARENMNIKSVPTIIVGHTVFHGTPSSLELEKAINEFQSQPKDFFN